MQNVIGPNTNSRKLGEVEQVEKHHWIVYSLDPDRYDEGKNYHVVFNDHLKKFTCNCPEFLFRHSDLSPCKHCIQVAKLYRKEK